MSKTPIEWTERTWNPVRGCSPISPGCKNCYAERTGGRFCGAAQRSGWEDGNRLEKKAGPFHGFVKIDPAGRPRFTGKVAAMPHMMDLPLHVRKPTTWFVNSMSDLFHEQLPHSVTDQVFTTMVAADWHTYQILTKRDPRPYFESGCHDRGVGPDRANYHLEDPPFSGQRGQIWLGVSVEDRKRKERIQWLRETPADHRFLSIEPLLEDIGTLDLRGIHWVIVGGESGPGARPCAVQWILNVIAQCTAQRVPVFVKQLGARVIDRNDAGFEGDTVRSWPMDTKRTDLAFPGWQGEPLLIKLKQKKGNNPAEWPEALRIRQNPAVAR